MKKNSAQDVIIHIDDNINFYSLADKISEFHADSIERKLNQLNLTAEQKIVIVDKIIENLKLKDELLKV